MIIYAKTGKAIQESWPSIFLPKQPVNWSTDFYRDDKEAIRLDKTDTQSGMKRQKIMKN